jgi:16S rRNA U516 pseudouridylate synthase RsuA-like enzyme
MKFIYLDKNRPIVNLDMCSSINKDNLNSGKKYYIVFKGCDVYWSFTDGEERDFVFDLIMRGYSECVEMNRRKG